MNNWTSLLCIMLLLILPNAYKFLPPLATSFFLCSKYSKTSVFLFIFSFFFKYLTRSLILSMPFLIISVAMGWLLLTKRPPHHKSSRTKKQTAFVQSLNPCALKSGVDLSGVSWIGTEESEMNKRVLILTNYRNNEASDS